MLTRPPAIACGLFFLQVTLATGLQGVELQSASS